MNHVTRQEAEKLIERFEVVDKNSPLDPLDWHLVEIQPVLIGDVLEKMKQQNKLTRFYNNVCSCWKDDCACPSGKTVDHQAELLELCHNCGVTKSLQEILDSAEWEEGFARKQDARGFPYAQHEERMKSPAAELFKYLILLFPEK
jgi:hypothetical protein